MSFINHFFSVSSPAAFVSHGGLTEQASSPINVAYPAGIQAGDIAILHCTKDVASGDCNTIVVPGDWTLINDTQGPNFNHRQALYWKRLVGTESGNISVSSGSTVSTSSLAGIISAWRGCLSSGTPVGDVATTTTGGLGDTTIESPGCTTTGLNRTVIKAIHCAGDLSNTPQPMTPGGGFTELYDLNGTLGTCDPRLNLSSLEVATASVVGSDTTTSANTSNTWRCAQFALIPIGG